jgi:TonB family protein
LRWGTVIISTALHLGVAASLITVAERKGLGKKTITVAVTRDEKKKKEDKPPPPKPIAKPAAPKPAAPAKAEAPSAPARAAPVATNLAMSNTDMDVGPGIGLEGRAKVAPQAAPVKAASNISERRTNRAKEELGGGAGEDQPCTEDPTKPVPIVQTEINYTVYPQAQADGIEGKFVGRMNIDANGEVVSVDIVTSIDPGFDAAIVAALKRWRFKPAMACGKPVPGTQKFSARFELGD